MLGCVCAVWVYVESDIDQYNRFIWFSTLWRCVLVYVFVNWAEMKDEEKWKLGKQPIYAEI